ncbi:MAG: LuxR C-terminal-related transcriptional regulator [Ginsengibacter sp.]
MSTPITLIIAHNHYVFSDILQNIVESHSGIVIVARMDNGKALLKKVKELQPDVVLAGLELKGMPDKAAWQKLLAGCDKTKLVISWRHQDADKLPAMIRALHAGYIARDASPIEYLYAVKEAAKGKAYYCSQTQLRQSLNGAASFAKSLDDTWLRMLYCICMGYSNKEIAMATGLKENTIKSYRKKLKSTMGYRSVAGMEGMLSDEL